jgi:hypothetical protein
VPRGCSSSGSDAIDALLFMPAMAAVAVASLVWLSWTVVGVLCRSYALPMSRRVRCCADAVCFVVSPLSNSANCQEGKEGGTSDGRRAAGRQK